MTTTSIPNHRMTSGINASGGMLRIICRLVSRAISILRKDPVNRPRMRPSPPPMAKPASALPALTRMWVHNSPDSASVQPAFRTANGSGRMRVDSQPKSADSSQMTRMAIGRSQGNRPLAPSPRALIGDFMRFSCRRPADRMQRSTRR